MELKGTATERMSGKSQTEQFPSPPNLPPGDTAKGRLMFAARRFADLQVATVLDNLVPWLNGLDGKVLEVGCGAQPYRHFLPEKTEYRGLDWEQAAEHFDYKTPDTDYYDGTDFPYDANTYDHLFHTEVIEHIYKKEHFLMECKRVLKPGGNMFFDVPFQARYHYIPNDYWRFTPAAIQRLMTDAGFTEINILPRGTDITVAVYKFVSVVFRWLQSGIAGKITGILLAPAVVFFLVLGHLSVKLKLGSDEDCMGYSVTARA